MVSGVLMALLAGCQRVARYAASMCRTTLSGRDIITTWEAPLTSTTLPRPARP